MKRSLLLLLASTVLVAADPAIKAPYFGIQVIDEDTGRGIPMTELRTVNDVRGITDNAGWMAFNEPGLMDREVWFYISLSPGYQREKDGFGYTGARLKTTPGTSATVKLKRTNIAERLARTTGQAIAALAAHDPVVALAAGSRIRSLAAIQHIIVG